MAIPAHLNAQPQEQEQEEDWMYPPPPPLDVPLDLQCLLIAAEEGDPEALQQALGSLEGSVDGVGEDGDTALHLACLYGHLPCVQILLAAGAQLDALDDDGAIPLHDASAGGYVDIVQTLLSAASSRGQLQRLLETIDVDGDTPLHHAARGDHAEVVHLLFNAGANPKALNAQWKTPAELADPCSDTKQILENLALQSEQQG
eukprot:c11345_g1_i1 orf=245-850(+)